MIAEVCSRRGLALREVVDDAFVFFKECQRSDGSIRREQDTLGVYVWDTVNVLKSVSLWGVPHGPGFEPFTENLLGFLKSSEMPTGMLNYSGTAIGPGEYCSETSSEYVVALARIGRMAEARQKARYLRSRQLASGHWASCHPFVAPDHQVAPSVTAFVLLALWEAEVPPIALERALDALARTQKSDGQFGIDPYYYNTPYYLLCPTIAALSQYGFHGAVAAARDYVLSSQQADGSWPGHPDEMNGSSPELHSAFALEILAHAGMTAAAAPVARGVDWLLSCRTSGGYWQGGKYPFDPEVVLTYLKVTGESSPAGRPLQDVYATAQVLSAFKQLEVTEAHHGAQV